MSIFKYAKVVLPTPAIGSVLICLAGVSLGALLLLAWGRSGIGVSGDPRGPMAQSGPPPVVPRGVAPSKVNGTLEQKTVAARHSTVPPGSSRPAVAWGTGFNVAGAGHETGKAPGRPRGQLLVRAIFQKPIAREQLGFLSEYAGRPANDVVREQRLRDLVGKVVPYAPFHLGLDVPLPNAIEGMLANSALPVEIRDGRYVMVCGRRGQNARGRGFIWVDMQEGIALGGIFFYPSNGEPTPTLTLFSKQVKESALGMSRLPLAFAQDLGRWAATEGVPPITTRYLINASNDKVLLAHDEDFCKTITGVLGVGGGDCKKMNEDAAQIDMKAARYLEQTQYASNATIRTAADRTP